MLAEERIPYTGLRPGERVLISERQSLRSRIGRFILLGVLMFISLLLIPVFIGLILLPIVTLALIREIIALRSNMYWVTTLRVIREKRLFGRKIEETTLDHITDIVFSQGFLGRILDYGDIHIHTAGTGFPGVSFKGIRAPMYVRGVIIQAKTRLEHEKL